METPVVDDDVEIIENFGESSSTFTSYKKQPLTYCCCGASAGLFLYGWKELPEWQKDNGFIRSHYRVDLTITESLKSIFAIHNETGNVWSHGLGAILFLGFLVHAHLSVLSVDNATTTDRVVFTMQLLAVVTCFFLSATFHTFLGTNERLVLILSKLDYIGIAIIMLGSFTPLVYYMFRCSTNALITYFVIMLFLFVCIVVTTSIPAFEQPHFRTFRAKLFSFFGLLVLIPVLHFFVEHGQTYKGSGALLVCLLLEMLFLVGGAFIFAHRIPEKYSAGRFDLWGHSHQIFHIAVILGNVVHYVAILGMFHNKEANKC